MTWRAIPARPIARHVIEMHLNPRPVSYMASYDAASDVRPALGHGGGGAAQGEGARGGDAGGGAPLHELVRPARNCLKRISTHFQTLVS